MARYSDTDTIRALRQALEIRILVLDGAMGTSLEALRPSAADFGGEALEGCNESLNLHAPHLVEAVHRSFIEAGADVVETNSFNGSTIVLGEYGLQNDAVEINRRAAEIARAAAAKHAGQRRVFVAGSMGPTNRAITVTGGVTFEELVEAFRLQALGLPVHARGAHPATGSNVGPGALNVPIQCGGVAVHPGDVVRADRSGVVVVRAGGLAEVVAKETPVIQHVDPWLTLDGLRIIYEMNRG